MRYHHILGGALAFGVGLFLAYLWSPMVVMTLKGVIQLGITVVGLLALLSVVFDKTRHKIINLTVAVALLSVSAYGAFTGSDEYFALVDLIFGAGPIFLVVFGLVAVVHGIRRMT